MEKQRGIEGVCEGKIAMTRDLIFAEIFPIHLGSWERKRGIR